MASFLFLILLFVTPASLGTIMNPRLRGWFLLVVVLTTFVIPVISVLILRFAQGVKTWQLRDRRERVLPFFFITVFYVLTAYLIIDRLNISSTINHLFIAMAALIFLTAVITLFWKISIHSVGMAGVFGILVALNLKIPDDNYLWVMILWLMATGLTMSARLALNVHRPAEIYSGGALGFLYGFIFVYFGP